MSDEARQRLRQRLEAEQMQQTRDLEEIDNAPQDKKGSETALFQRLRRTLFRNDHDA